MAAGLWLFGLLMSLEQASVVSDTGGVVLPKTVRGVGGSCVVVPCRLLIPEQHLRDGLNCSNSDLRWTRVQGVGTPDSPVSQGRVVGDVKNLNCTSLFSELSEDKFHRFRLSLDCFRFTFNETLRIFLQRDPPPPQMDSVPLLREGQRVELRCSVPVPCPGLPPSVTWLPQDGAIGQQAPFQQGGTRLWTLTSTLTFVASANHHNRSFTCSASYPLLNGSISASTAVSSVLSVLYAPRSTEAALLRSGPEGQTLTLVCSSDANPPVSAYSWYRQSCTGQLIRQGPGQVMVLTSAQLDSGAFLCEAENAVGSQRSGPVPLLPSATTALSGSAARVLFVLWGLLLLLHILMGALTAHRHQGLSRRLKQIEAQKEHTYAELRRDTVDSEYNQLQQLKAAAPTPDVPDYVIPLPN